MVQHEQNQSKLDLLCHIYLISNLLRSCFSVKIILNCFWNLGHHPTWVYHLRLFRRDRLNIEFGLQKDLVLICKKIEVKSLKIVDIRPIKISDIGALRIVCNRIWLTMTVRWIKEFIRDDFCLPFNLIEMVILNCLSTFCISNKSKSII